MSVARVTELSAVSDKGFEDAINQAVACDTKTLRGVEGCWVRDIFRIHHPPLPSSLVGTYAVLWRKDI
jgi:hypothetical protein